MTTRRSRDVAEEAVAKAEAELGELHPYQVMAVRKLRESMSPDLWAHPDGTPHSAIGHLGCLGCLGCLKCADLRLALGVMPTLALLLLVGCGSPAAPIDVAPDAAAVAEVDAGAAGPDAGPADASVTRDAGLPAPEDAGAPDVGAPDAGPCGGEHERCCDGDPRCGIAGICEQRLGATTNWCETPGLLGNVCGDGQYCAPSTYAVRCEQGRCLACGYQGGPCCQDDGISPIAFGSEGRCFFGTGCVAPGRCQP